VSKNILELCLSPDLGGLELCVVDYFTYFSQKGSSFLCVAKDKKLDNYTVNRNKFSLKRSKFFPIIPALQIAKFIDANEIDVIHFHWTKDIATAVLAKLFSKRKPQLMQSRHMRMTRFKDDFYHKWLYKNLDLMHTVTLQVKEQLIKYIPQDIRPKIEMIYLGVDEPSVDMSRVKKLQMEYHLDDSFVVGIVGRIEEPKGQYLLIEAIAKLQEFNIKALIIGQSMNDAYLSDLKEKINLLGIQERVIFTGFTKEINEHISLCDVSVLATKKETFGLVIIESMINRVPVIATNEGGPLEIIDDGRDGLFFNRSSDDLAKKILLLYKDRELRKSLSVSAYEKVKKKFDKQTQMQKMYEVINES